MGVLLLLCLPVAAVAASASSPLAALQLEAIPDAWRDDSGARFELHSLRGENVVVTMAYARCHRTCPLTLRRLQQLQRMFDERGVRGEFVVIGYDPQGDDVRAWHQYRLSHGLRRANWHFLWGNEAQVEQTASLLGLPFWRYDDHIMHEARILFFDTTGLAHEEPELVR